jgi:hypothetical protein
MEPKFGNTLLHKQKLLCMLLLLLFVKTTSGQNQFGMVGGNYAGLQAIKINPANICYQPVSLDINAVSVYGNINNNNYYATPTFLLSYDSVNSVCSCQSEV